MVIKTLQKIQQSSVVSTLVTLLLCEESIDFIECSMSGSLCVGPRSLHLPVR